MAGQRPKGSPERIGRLLAGNGVPSALASRLKDLDIWLYWRQAVGEAIAARTRPLRLQGGVLTVLVSGGPWMQQLSFMKQELVQRINQVVGEQRVRELVLKGGSIASENPGRADRPAKIPELTRERQEWIRQQLPGLAEQDQELSRSLQGLMEAHFRYRDR